MIITTDLGLTLSKKMIITKPLELVMKTLRGKGKVRLERKMFF